MVHSPRIEIEYCTQCRWLLRAAWMAQELLTTFRNEIGELVLVSGTRGEFEVRIGDEVIWSRVDRGRFPDIKELKQLARDRVAPDKDLGHSENRKQQAEGKKQQAKSRSKTAERTRTFSTKSSSRRDES